MGHCCNFLNLSGLLYLSAMHRKCIPAGAIISTAHALNLYLVKVNVAVIYFLALFNL